jgi:predicted ABC-type ATPase
MFAGPNGSGKSTLKNELPDKLIGFYLNADEIEQDLRTNAGLEFSDFGLTVESQDVLNFFAQSPLLKSQGLEATMQSLHFSTNRLDFSGVAVNSVNSYVASVAVDFLRHKLLEAGRSFTFETVMSHLGKVEFLSTARQAGFRIYLYYVATDDPAINISRVHNRVNMGGHDVPDDKVESRYYRSLELLLDAIRKTDRSYIFDNSSSGGPQNKTWLAEVTDGKDLELKVDRIPAWFKKYVLDKAND